MSFREVAHALRLPKINWTLIRSSTSASDLTRRRIEIVLVLFVQTPVENFCCMHLGVNLRKAGLKTTESTQREYPRVVHEFCKLLGKLGVPEYGLGAMAFPDFLGLSTHESDKASYYQHCSVIKLEIFRYRCKCRKDTLSL